MKAEIEEILNGLIAAGKTALQDVSKHFSENKTVAYSDLINDSFFPPGEKVTIGQGVTAKKEIQGGRIRFTTEMPRGSHLGLHKHDCFEGSLILEGGKVVDLESGRVFDHSFYLEPDTSHNIIALKDSVLIVDFYPA